MIKENLKKNIIAVAIGFLIWLFLSLFGHQLAFIVLDKSLRYNPQYLWIYGLIASLVAAFFVGWIGKSKGWILGLITQLVITLFLILFSQLHSFTDKLINEGILSFLNSLLKYIQISWFLSASCGGYLGEKIRRK